MNWAWRFGMIILTGVPAIVGGGLFFSIFDSWNAVIAWEVILIVLMGTVIIRGGKSAASSH